MSIMQKVALMGSLAAMAHAHGRIISVDVDGTEYEGYTSGQVGSPSTGIAWSADNQDNGFVGPDSYTSTDIACHKSAEPGPKAATIAAGGSLTLQWDTWPESHHGPVLDYLAKCAGDDCSSVSAGDLSFFKIDEAGLNDGAAQDWASDDLIANGNAWTVTIPEDIAPGQYVLRHEIIALHSAQDANGAQNYPQCINIEVTGSGSAEPAGVAATELYTPEDPGISLSIYNGLTSYEIPGPAVYSGGASSSSSSGSSGASSSASSSGSSNGTAETSAAATTSSAAQATTSAASNNNNQGSNDNGSSAPEPTGAPTFAGEATASKTAGCTTTITLTATADSAPSATSAPIETSDDSESSDDSEEESQAPTTTSASSAPDVSAIASSLPSSVLDAPVSSETGSSSSSSDDGRPAKDLPEGFTLKDLLEWVNYLLNKAFQDGNHARDVTRR